MVAQIDYEEKSVELVQRYNSSHDILYLEELYILHKGLFYRVAQRFVGYMEIDDLMQECYFSLLKAVEGYEPASGSFTKYLVKVTNSYLYRVIQEKNGNIPQYMLTIIKGYFALMELLEANNLPKPNDNIIAKHLNVSKETIKSMYLAIDYQNKASLDTPVDEAEGVTLADLTPGAENLEETCIDEVFKEEVAQRVHECIAELEEKDQAVINGYFLEGKTLKELNPNISNQANKQKLDKAFKRLKRISEYKLQDLYDEVEAMTTNKALNSVKRFQRTFTSGVEATVMYKLSRERRENKRLQCAIAEKITESEE